MTAAAIADRAPRIHGFLASAILVAVVAVTFALFFRVIPQENRDPFLLILGALLTRLGDVYAYFFGSTNESRTKTDALASVASTQAQTAPTPAPGTAVTVAAADVTATTTVTDAESDDGDELPPDQRVLS